jgi:hypothetical protein
MMKRTFEVVRGAVPLRKQG